MLSVEWPPLGSHGLQHLMQALVGRLLVDPIDRSQLADQGQAMVTVHPSYLLRIPDAAGRKEAYGRFVEDLAAAYRQANLRARG